MRSSRSGRSSVTDEAGAIDDAAIAKLADEIAGLRADGHEIIVVSSGAVAAGVAALGLPSRPTDISHAAGARRRRPAPADAQLGRRPRRPRARAGPGAAGAARLRRPPPVPPRPAHAEPAAGAGHGADHQRERRHRPRRGALRRQRPHRRPRRAQHRGRRDGAADRPRRALHRRSPQPTRRPASSSGCRPTTRCWRSAPVPAAAGGAAVAWPASWRRPASPRGRACAR